MVLATHPHHDLWSPFSNTAIPKNRNSLLKQNKHSQICCIKRKEKSIPNVSCFKWKLQPFGSTRQPVPFASAARHQLNLAVQHQSHQWFGWQTLAPTQKRCLAMA